MLGSRPRARLTAFVVFAWNPLMLFDAAGNAHNDALMVTLLLLGVVPLVWHRRGEQIRMPRWSLGTFFVGMSALIKYTTGLVGLFYIVPWATRLPSWPRARAVDWRHQRAGRRRSTVVLFIPWLDFPRAFEPMLVAAQRQVVDVQQLGARPGRADRLGSVLDPSAPTIPTATHEMRALLGQESSPACIFAVYLGWELVRLWRIAGDRERSLVEPILEASARAFVVLILLVLTWVLEWYWMWPLALVTLLGWRRMLTKVVVGYTLTSLPIFYVHHYWSTNMPGVLVLAYALPPLAVAAGRLGMATSGWWESRAAAT